MSEKIPPEEVIARYEGLEDIWPATDRWHSHTCLAVHSTVKKWVLEGTNNAGKILNIGSGGSSYGLPPLNITHTDLCGKNLRAGDGVISNAENLPFADESFDVTICVGSVLNYCDALVAIGEMSRVTKTNGRLILEFEKSDNLEYLRSPAFCANAALVTTFYAGEKERIWVFREKHVRNLLTAMQFKIRRRQPVHIVSSVLLLLLSNRVAAKFGLLDRLAATLPILNRFASNVILECEKLSPGAAALP